MSQPVLQFPTNTHRDVAEVAYGFFTNRAEVDTVLVVNSCARGKATPSSDLDMAVLVKSLVCNEAAQRLEGEWQAFRVAHPLVQAFEQSGPFMHVHLDVIHGEYTPPVWDDGGGPDGFELEVGNQVCYAAPLGTPGLHFEQLRDEWLPFYNDELRAQRLHMVREACLYDLDHVGFFVGRQLYFQAFDRLYKAFGQFLQALFIARRTYPVAYNKWIREQVEQWLGLPELYRALPPVLSVSNLESEELTEKAQMLRALLNQWTAEE